VTPAGRFAPQLFFLDPDSKPLFASAALPAAAAPRHGVLVCPAFAEEMNRTRRTVRLLMEQAAQAGLAVINVDLAGTGDSAGEFADARWEDWLANLELGRDWLRRQGCTQVSLLGVRAGALLAWQLALAAREPFHRLLLWQPVPTGQAVLTDLLRTRLLAPAADGKREGVAALRAQLQGGSAVEAAGYTLSPQLAAALDAARIGATPTDRRLRIAWLEIVADAAADVRPVAVQSVARLVEAGLQAELLRAQDPPFWATTETTTGHASVAASLRWLEERA